MDRTRHSITLGQPTNAPEWGLSAVVTASRGCVFLGGGGPRVLSLGVGWRCGLLVGSSDGVSVAM